MPKLDTYLFREFTQATFAVLVVLMVVSLGGVFADVLGDIARGRVPAGMMLSQLGLQVLNYLPLILPLGLMIGLLLSVGRLYRDSEMPVLTATGVGPKRLLRPVLMLVVPMITVIGLCSLWLGPWARDYSQRMIAEGNRSPPRQSRYGRTMLAFLGYFVSINLTMLGQDWIADGKLAPGLGLWWLLLPLLAFASWAYVRDGRLRRPRRRAA